MWARRWATPRSCPRACPHGPLGSRRSAGRATMGTTEQAGVSGTVLVGSQWTWMDRLPVDGTQETGGMIATVDHADIRERARQAAEEPARRRQIGVARDLAGRQPSERATGFRSVCRHLRGQVSEARRVPRQGPNRAPCVLRLSSRPLQLIRATNPIESTFATIRLRTRKTRNCVSAKSGLALMHQLAMSAQKRWRRLRGFRQLADVVASVKFIDGTDERTTS